MDSLSEFLIVADVSVIYVSKQSFFLSLFIEKRLESFEYSLWCPNLVFGSIILSFIGRNFSTVSCCQMPPSCPRNQEKCI